MRLNEVKRNQLLSKSKNADSYAPNNQDLGINRYARSKHSSISKRVNDYNIIDFNKFFKKDILSFGIEVRGETDNYKVKIRLYNILRELEIIAKRNPEKEIEWADIHEAFKRVFDNGDVYISCTCPDFKYTFDSWSHIDHWAETQVDPGPGKGIRNPNNSKGAGCKHILLVLRNGSWVRTLCEVINNYIKLMKESQERLYQKIIYPKIYGRQYSEIEQQQLFNPDTGKKARDYLSRSKDTIAKANAKAIERNRFKPGNKLGMRFTKNKDENEPDQVELDLEDNATAEQ